MELRSTCSHVHTIATCISAQEVIGSKVVGSGRISQDLERARQRELANHPFLPVREEEALRMKISSAWYCSIRLRTARGINFRASERYVWLISSRSDGAAGCGPPTLSDSVVVTELGNQQAVAVISVNHSMLLIDALLPVAG